MEGVKNLYGNIVYGVNGLGLCLYRSLGSLNCSGVPRMLCGEYTLEFPVKVCIYRCIAFRV